VTEAFKLYATGRYNAYELNDLLYEKGLTTNANKKLTPSMFYVMLKNRLYLGEIHWQDIHVKDGKHEPLVDEVTFNQVQKVSSEKSGSRCRRRKYFWLLNGYVFCPIHGRRFTAEWHLNKEKAYYHCPNKSGCGKYIEKSELENQVAEKFKDLEFDPKFVYSIIEKVRSMFQEGERTIFLNKESSSIKRMRGKQSVRLQKTDYSTLLFQRGLYSHS